MPDRPAAPTSSSYLPGRSAEIGDLVAELVGGAVSPGRPDGLLSASPLAAAAQPAVADHPAHIDPEAGIVPSDGERVDLDVVAAEDVRQSRLRSWQAQQHRAGVPPQPSQPAAEARPLSPTGPLPGDLDPRQGAASD